MAERGESRAIYTVITDDPEFLALSPLAKCVWYTLKMRLGVSGIRTASSRLVSDWTGIPDGQVPAIEDELRAGRWLVTERNVYWLRNGLAFDPYVTLINANHTKAINSHLRGLPKLAIVNAFATYYKLPLPFEGVGSETPAYTHPRTHPNGNGNQEVGSRKKEEGTTSVDKSTGENPPSIIPPAKQNDAIPATIDSLFGGPEAPHPDELPNTHATWMPMLRELGYEASRSDGDILKVLIRKRVKARDIEAAIRGLPLLVKLGRYPIPAGQKLNMRILYASGKGKMPAWTQAADAYFEAEGKKRPVDMAKL